jgi:hypothetical protein
VTIEQLDALQRQIHDLIYKVMETETNFSDHGLAKESRGMADIVNKLHEIDNNIEAEMDRLNTPGESELESMNWKKTFDNNRGL